MEDEGTTTIPFALSEKRYEIAPIFTPKRRGDFPSAGPYQLLRGAPEHLFPDRGGLFLEDEIGIARQDPPISAIDLALKLARRPSGVAGINPERIVKAFARDEIGEYFDL